MTTNTAAIAAEMRQHLEKLKRLRGPQARADMPARVAEVKRWQTARLMKTYEDLNANPRYRAATAYFVQDLYGPKDFSARDAALLKLLPMMARILPSSVVETAALSVEVEALSEELDHRLAAALPAGEITEGPYAQAYRESATPEERMRQIQLIVDVGHRLEAIVRWPLVFRTLKLMRQPAKLAGLTDLQDFLERGFQAFAAMGGADEFLTTIAERETAILKRLFSGAPEPFSTGVAPSGTGS
jgi:hypothetical protein